MTRLLILFSLFTIQNINAQTENVFPNISASWEIRAWTWSGTSGEQIPDYGHSYRISMSIPTDSADGLIWNELHSPSSPYPIGRIAQDSGIVFYHNYEDETESIIELYNFNLAIGDTAYIEGDIAVKVEDIGSTLVLGVERTILYLDNADQWIHGMGSIQGLFRPLQTPLEYGLVLCHYDGEYTDSLGLESTYLYTPESSVCFLSTAEEKAELFIKVFPNPTTNHLNIMYSGEETIYNISDTHGRSVKTEKLRNGENRLDVSKLASGIYFLTINHNSQIITIK